MFAITHARIETVANGAIDRGAIVVDNEGLIQDVGSRIAIPDGCECIDADGAIVTPGLIEAHSHAGLKEDGFYHDSDMNETSDPTTPHMMALDGFKPSDMAMAEAAENGITTMYLTQGSGNIIGGIGAIVKTWGTSYYGQVVKPAAGMKMAMGENPKRAYGSKGKAPITRMAVAALLREALLNAQHYADRKRTHEQKEDKDKGPFAISLRDEALVRLLNGEFPARCHAHRSADMLTFMRIAGDFGFRYVFEHATECVDILPDLVDRNIPLVIGPSLGDRSKLELHRKGGRTVVEAVKAGLLVAITSDHNITPMRYLNVYAALAVREGLSNADALRAITLNPARILGIDDFLGSLETGKEADIVLWNGDPLDVRSRPRKVFVKGRQVEVPDAQRSASGNPCPFRPNPA